MTKPTKKLKSGKIVKKEMTEKEKRFVQNYVISWNGAEAVRQAGFKVSGQRQYAQSLLSKPYIIKAVLDEKEKYTKKIELTAERVYQEYARIAFFDIKKLYDEDGNLKRIIDIDRDTRAAISSCDVIDVTEDGKPTITIIKKLKMIDKKGALDSAAKILNLFKDDNNKNVNLTWEQQLDALTD